MKNGEGNYSLEYAWKYCHEGEADLFLQKPAMSWVLTVPGMMKRGREMCG